jgi:glutamyl-tRNA reductase
LHFTVIGLNHRTAPIEVRERITIPDTRLSEALRALGGRPEFSEAAILSTCNRTEIYTVVPHPGHERAVHHFIEDYHGVKAAEYASHVYVHHDAEAVRHLFRVASGLDSLVLGEGQILKQVRDAFAAASDAGTAGKLLNGLFRAAIAAGRRARTETEIGKGGFSVGHAAVDLARSIFGSLDGASILILGAGKMSELTARHLVANGVRFVMVANRTYERAAALAEKLGGSAIRYDDFPEAMSRADIVISSTASPHPIVTRKLLQPVMRRRRGRSLLLIDIAVPRDIEPEVDLLDNVFLKNVDDLEEVVSDMARERAGEVAKVDALLDEEIDKFVAWWRSLSVAPVVTRMREKHEEIRLAELARLRNQLPDLPDRAWQNIEAAMRSLMNRMQRDPIERLKDAATRDLRDSAAGGPDLFDAARALFALDAPRYHGRPDAADAALPRGSGEGQDAPPRTEALVPHRVEEDR